MTREQPSVTQKDFAIGVLSVTAVILLAALLMVQAFMPQQAMAFGQAVWSDNYRVATCQLEDTRELLLVVNNTTQQMNVYGLDVNTGRIMLYEQIDIQRLTQDQIRGREARETGAGRPTRRRR